THRDVGNREVLEELRRAGDFSRFVTDYIDGVREIRLKELLEPYGIVLEATQPRGPARFVVASKLSERQRAVFAGLGAGSN
ncbi:MAG: hypothetical protein ABI882_18215, partial [Acidobacteriota bacterium]